MGIIESNVNFKKSKMDSELLQLKAYYQLTILLPKDKMNPGGHVMQVES